MGHESTVARAFPALDDIRDAELRTAVLDTWTITMESTGVATLADVPWLPTVQRELGLEDETLVEHVRDVTVAATALGEAVAERRDVDLDMDVVRATGLVHDVSQLAEFDGWEPTPIYRLLGHPYWAVYPMERAGLPVAVQHAVLAHSPFSNVEPATMEAVVVSRADYAVSRAIRARTVDDLREGP